MVLEMRDGGKSKVLDKVIQKAVVNINDIITHMLLKMDVWEQAEIDKPTVETLDGTKNESSLITMQHGANATVAVPTRVCRAGAAQVRCLFTRTSRNSQVVQALAWRVWSSRLCRQQPVVLRRT